MAVKIKFGILGQQSAIFEWEQTLVAMMFVVRLQSDCLLQLVYRLRLTPLSSPDVNASSEIKHCGTVWQTDNESPRVSPPSEAPAVSDTPEPLNATGKLT